MASTSETGNVKNIAAFKELLSICVDLGAGYQPKKAILQISYLNGVISNTNNAMMAWADLKGKYQKNVDDCEIVFNELKLLAPQVIGALKSSDATEEVVETAMGWYRRFLPKPKPKKKKGETSTDGKKPRSISTSHQSRVKLIETFTGLVTAVSKEPSYDPNEPFLKIMALRTFQIKMQTVHDAVMTSLVAERGSRAIRDKNLYEEKTGLVAVGNAVKVYIQSAFAKNTQNHKRVDTVKFTNFKTVNT